MFTRILVPIDGSKLSKESAIAAVSLARNLGAEIVAFVVTPVYKMRVIEDAAFAPGTLSEVDFNRAVKRSSKTYLGEIQTMAEARGIVFTAAQVSSDKIAPAIIEAAEKHGCDLIFIGSHGRSNLVQIFLGGVTTKVLSLSSIPVMVYRSPKKKAKRAAAKRA